MSLINLEQLHTRLEWPHIHEERVAKYCLLWFRAMPTDKALASIDFLFDDDVSMLQQLGSGAWHYHPDDIDDAIETARKLIHHELCIIEQQNHQGDYIGSGLNTPDGVPKSLRRDTKRLVRRFFNQAPLHEEIDFSRYEKVKRSYIEHNHKAAIDATWKKLGRPPQW